MEKPEYKPSEDSKTHAVAFKVTAALVKKQGYESAEIIAVDVLTNVFKKAIVNIGRMTKKYAEHAGRAESTCGDFVMALAQLGIRVAPEDLGHLADCSDRPIFGTPGEIAKLKAKTGTLVAPPSETPQPPDPNFKVPTILPPKLKTKSTEVLELPEHIPKHMPAMPPPIAFKHDPRILPPLSVTVNYEMFRELMARKKRTIENSMIRFHIATLSKPEGDNRSTRILPVVRPSYLDAVTPKDHPAPVKDIFPPVHQSQLDMKKKYRLFTTWDIGPKVTYTQAAAAKGYQKITKHMRKKNLEKRRIKSVEGVKFLERLLRDKPPAPRNSRLLKILKGRRKRGLRSYSADF